MTTRTYINATDDARSAVAEIVQLVKSGIVQPIVSFDVETSPILGLERYPGTAFTEEGERIAPKKKDYLELAQQRWFENFNPAYLESYLNIRVPWKTTTGSESPGVPAKQAWADFNKAVQAASVEALDACRWPSEHKADFFAADLSEEIAWTKDQIEELSGVKGKKKAVEALKTALERAEWRWNLMPKALESVKKPLDTRLLKHIVAVGAENRVKVDPVAPGLDPFTSEIFTVQITLRRKDDKELLTWVFNAPMVGLETLKPIFKVGRNFMFLGHNIKFDLKMLMAHLGKDAAPRNVFCTRIGSRLLYLGLKKMSHSLKACALRYCNQRMEKGVRDTFIGVRRDEPTQEQIDYGAFDTEILFELHDEQIKLAGQREQINLLQEFSKLSWITALWEVRGYPIDAEKWMEIAAQNGADRDELARQIEDMLLPAGYRETFGDTPLSQDEDAEEDEDYVEPDDESETFNGADRRPDALIRVSQTKLVAERLAQVLGNYVTMMAFGEGGKVSLGKDARGGWERAYRNAHGDTHPFFSLYERWAKRAKQASTYGARFLWTAHPITGRIHPNLNIAGTDTGRYSGGRPNMLNIPAAKEPGDPDYRGAFRSLPGYLLLGADYEAMEMRIAFCITGDEVGRKMIESGRDAHSFTAAMAFHIKKGQVSGVVRRKEAFKYGTTTLEIDVFEVPAKWTNAQIADFALTDEVVEAVNAVPKKSTRSVAKTITFLYLFGGSAFTLSVRTGLPMEQCEDFFSRFESVYIQLSSGMSQLREEVLYRVIEGNDGHEYTWAEAYGGLRRWFQMPTNPSRRDYGDGWAGDMQFDKAQREYKRRIRSLQREAGNVPCQGGNAWITALALNKIVDDGYAMDVLPYLSIYDEIIVMFPETVKPEIVKDILEDAMKGSAEDYMTFVQAGAEADTEKVANYWKKS